MKKEVQIQGEEIKDEVDEALNVHYQLNPEKPKIVKLHIEPAKIQRKALFDDILLKNMKIHTSLAD